MTNASLVPEQGIKVGLNTAYLVTDQIIENTQYANEWAVKTDGLVRNTDYSAKAYAIGGTGTETNNALYYKNQASAAATSASTSATIASTSATIASTSATSASTSATTAQEAALSAVKRNIGELITSLLPITSADVHLTDGSLISSVGIYAQFATYLNGLTTDYPNLFCTETEWQAELEANEGQCSKFVIDSTANTIRLPKITEYIKGVSSLSELGSCLKAGLPNITFPNVMVGPSSVMPVAGTSAYGSTSGATVTLTSSVSNPIYGNSETVTPTSAKCAYYIVLATSVKTDIEVDIDNVASDLNLLSNTTANATIFNATGKETVVGWGMPDYSRASVLTAPTSPYTITKKSRLICHTFKYANQLSTLQLYLNGALFQNVSYTSTNDMWAESNTVYLDLDVGDTFNFNSTNASISCILIPFKGV